MSNFVSYLADPTDPTSAAVAVDLNGYETGFGLFETDHETFDLGAPDLDGIWLSEDGKDEDVLSAHRRGRVEASFDLRIGPRAPALPNITDLLRRLNAALDRGGVWVLQQPGSPSALYIDYYPSPLINQLMPGSRSLFHLWSQLQQPNGMRVRILRRPKMRGAALAGAVNLVHNGTFAEDHNHDGVPTFWSWAYAPGIAGDPVALGWVLFPDEGYDWTYGAHTALITPVAAGGGGFNPVECSQVIPVSAGVSYAFAIDAAASHAAGTPTLEALVEWRDSGATVLRTDLHAQGLVFTPQVGFGRPTLTAVSPTGAVTARVGLRATPADASAFQVWIRKAQLERSTTASAFRPGPETVSNDATQPFGKRIWLWNDGNTDALAELRVDPNAGAVTAQLTYDRRSGDRDSAMAMRYFPGIHAIDATALNGATNVAGEAGTLSAHALRSALVNNVAKPMLRHSVLPPDDSALRGTWGVKAAIRGALGDAYTLEARYGMGNVTDLPRSAGAPVTLDLVQPPAASDYVVVDLGFVRIPPGAPGLYLEVWAARQTGNPDAVGTGQVYVDQLWLEPADDDVMASATIPGVVVPGGPHSETIKGSDLDTPPSGLAGPPFVAGSIYNDELLLNDLNEACGVPLGWTSALTAGVEHTWVARLTLFTQNEKNAVKHGIFAVYDLTASAAVASVPLKNRAGIAWDAQSVTLRFTPVAAHAYLLYVQQTIAMALGNVRVAKVQHSFTVPAGVVGSPNSIDVDANSRQANVLDGDQFKASLPLIGAFPTLQPGVQLYRVAVAGLPSNGSDGVLDGQTPTLHDPARTALVTVSLVPRWTN